MGNIQVENSSTPDATVASGGSDVHFDQGYGGQPQPVFPGQQEALAIALR